MFVGVESGDSGWSEYVLLEDGKPRDGARLIQGDTELGDAICKSTDYKTGQYFRLVISFSPDEGVTPERGRKIAEEYIDLMMHGYRKDEYHVDLVEHTDTERLHYHARIPKLNLLTQTQLHYHYLSDIKRKDAIHHYLEAKHDLKSPFEERKLRRDPGKRVEQINKWREEHGQKPFDLSRKKGRGEAEERIADYIQEAVVSGYINSLEEVQAELREFGFQIVKVGHDNGKDFDYITIENETGKLRLKGDIYGERFYEHNREDQTKAIRSGKSFDRRDAGDRPSLASASAVLDRENRKRAKFIQDRFGKARERALSSAPAAHEGYRGRDRDKSEDHKRQRWEAEKRSVRSEREPDRQNESLGEVENDRVRAEAIRRIREIRARARSRARATSERIIDYTATAAADYQAIAEATAERGIRREAEQGFTAVIQAVTGGVQRLKRSFDNRAKSLAGLLRERVIERAKEKTMQELNHFKSTINLAEYAQSFGYQINRKKSTKISPVLQKDGETIVVGQDRRDNHYIYFNVGDNADSGTVLDFVQKRTGETLGKVRKRLRQWLGMPNPQVERVEVQPAALDEIELSMAKDKAQKLWNSLSDTSVSLFRGELRGIPIDTVKTAKDSVRRDDQGNWYFALRDADGEICGVEKRDKDGRNGRIAEAGQKKGIFVFGGQDGELCEKIIITESTIDALSAKYIANDSRHAFVSIGGNAGIVAQKAIKELCDKLPKAEIILATDNDQAGDRHAERIKELIGIGSRSYKRYRAKMKDINEDLVIAKAQRKAEREQTAKSINRGGMNR